MFKWLQYAWDLTHFVSKRQKTCKNSVFCQKFWYLWMLWNLSCERQKSRNSVFFDFLQSILAFFLCFLLIYLYFLIILKFVKILWFACVLTHFLLLWRKTCKNCFCSKNSIFCHIYEKINQSLTFCFCSNYCSLHGIWHIL